MDCLFCKITKGELPTEFIYEDNKLVAFADINPQAPLHKIITPRKHIATLNDINGKEDNELVAHMVESAINIAKELQIDKKGYRLVWNCNADAGQTIFHIHLHLLGGRQMIWPPG